MTQSLVGKTALVTGGARGIGAAIVLKLAQEGADVTFTYASSSEAAEELVAQVAGDGGRARALKSDASDREQLRRLIDDMTRNGGRLDIVVANAAAATMGPLAYLDDTSFDRVVDVNIRGTVDLIRFSLPHLRDGARIITIGSNAAHMLPDENSTIYGMSKAAIATLVRGLAREVGPKGATANNVQPGPTDTDSNPADGPYAEFQRMRSPLARFGKTSEIASLVAYLASEEAALINGASIDIDGGYSA